MPHKNSQWSKSDNQYFFIIQVLFLSSPESCSHTKRGKWIYRDHVEWLTEPPRMSMAQLAKTPGSIREDVISYSREATPCIVVKHGTYHISQTIKRGDRQMRMHRRINTLIPHP